MSDFKNKKTPVYKGSKYRVILYREIDKVWHFVRLSIAAPEQLLIETGLCGMKADQVQYKSLLRSTTDLEALRQEGLLWQAKGFGKPSYKHLSVMTLHFQLPRWRGAQSSAPWFENWAEQYLDPIYQVLDATANGHLKHHERISGNHLYYYSVFNPAAAKKAVEDISKAASQHYALEIYTGKREKTVNIPIDPSIPDYLRSILRGFEQTARILAEGLPILLPETDPLKPERIPFQPGDRVKGSELNLLRQLLKEKWGFDCQIWEPPIGIPTTVCLDGVPEHIKLRVIDAIKLSGNGQCYLLECDYGLFRIEPDLLLNGVYEGIAFDVSMSWVIYYTQHFSVVFCGGWLAAAAGELGHGSGQEQKTVQ